MSVAGLVLAAGGGRRYGGPKALVRLDGSLDGRLLVERAVATLREAGCAPIVVVLGAAAARVRSQAEVGDATLVDNAEWESGMGSSLRVGLTAVGATAATAVVVILVDMPGITPAAARRVAEHAGPAALVQASYGPRRGHPVLLGREHWAGVAALAEGDVGARPYLAGHRDRLVLVECGDVADDTDLDYPPAQGSR